MGVPTKFFTFIDSQAPIGKLTAARLNGDFDPLYACLDPTTGGLEDTNVKSGAKIVCTDRAHTVTGIWTFTTAPVLPAASIAEAKLVLNFATHSPANDPVADEKAALAGTSGTPSVTNKYVTDVDARNSDARTPSAHVHAEADVTGLVTDLSTLTDAAHCTLSVGAGIFDPTDGGTYLFSLQPEAPSASAFRRIYIPKAGVITVAYIEAIATTANGTNEDISVYIRLNGATDTLVKTVGVATGTRLFDNTSLSIAVAQGDYIHIKVVCPTWATNPTGVLFSGVLYVV